MKHIQPLLLSCHIPSFSFAHVCDGVIGYLDDDSFVHLGGIPLYNKMHIAIVPKNHVL